MILRHHTGALYGRVICLTEIIFLVNGKQILPLHIENDVGDRLLLFLHVPLLRGFQEEHRVGGLCRKTGDARDIEVCALRSEQEFRIQRDIERDFRCCVRVHSNRAANERILHIIQTERRRNLVYTRTTHLRPAVHGRIDALTVV